MDNAMNAKEYLSRIRSDTDIIVLCEDYYNTYIKNFLKTEIGYANCTQLLTWNHISDETLEVSSEITFEELKPILNTVLPMIQKIIGNLISDDVDEAVFYEKIWETLSNDTLFATDSDRICVLIAIILDARIPYYHLGKALEMEDSRYMELSKQLNQEILKSYYAINCGYTQKTQIASQLYKILNQIETEEEKIVCIANWIGYYDAKIKDLSEGSDKDESECTEDIN